MQSSSYKITGSQIGQLPDALGDALGVTALVKHDNVTVLCHEKYYLRIDSNLMSTVVISRTDEQVCYVDTVTGGGKTGLFGISLGAEKRNTNVVADTLIRVCSALNLDVAPA